MSGNPIRGGLKLYNVVSGALLGSTPNVAVASWTEQFDAVGSFSVSIPATDPAAAFLDDGAGALVLARLFVSNADYVAGTNWVTQWIVRDTQVAVSEGEWLKSDEGNNLFEEWSRATTLHGVYNYLTLQQILKSGAVGVNADGSGAQVRNLSGLLTPPNTIASSGVAGGLAYTASIPAIMIGSSIRFVVDANYDTRLRSITTLVARAGGKVYATDTLADGSRGHWWADPTTQSFRLGQIGTDNSLSLQGGIGVAVGDPASYTDLVGYLESIKASSVQDQVANRIYPLGGRSDSGLPESGFAVTGMAFILGKPIIAIHLGDANGGLYTTDDYENFRLVGMQNYGITSLSYKGDVDATHAGTLYASTSVGVFQMPSGLTSLTNVHMTKVGGLRARCARVCWDAGSSTIWALVRGDTRELDGIWRSPLVGTDPGTLADPSASLTPGWSKVVAPGATGAIEDMVPGASTRVYFLDTSDPTKLYRWDRGSSPQITSYALGVTTAKTLSVTADYIFIHTSEGMQRLKLATLAAQNADPFGNLPIDTYTVTEDGSGAFLCGTTNGIYSWDGNVADLAGTYWVNVQNAANCCDGIGAIAARFLLASAAQPMWIAADASHLYTSPNISGSGGQIWNDLSNQRVSLAAQFYAGVVTLNLPISPDVSSQVLAEGTGAPSIYRIYGPNWEYVYYIEDATSQGSYGIIDLPDQSEDLATSLYLNYRVSSQFLYEASVALLRRRRTRYVRYEVVASYGATGHRLHTAKIGDLLHITCDYEDGAGNIALKLSNVALYILSIERDLQDGFVRCTMEVGTSPNAGSAYTLPTLSTIVADMAWSKKNYALGV